MAKNFEEMLTEIFGAVDKIVDVRLQNLEYDKTVICEILSISNDLIGEYLVTDGTTKFFAYSRDIEYNVGDSVYVIIPNNNFNLQKNIIGKYSANKEESYNYVSPMESFLKCTRNYIDIDETEFSILANDISTTEKIVWEWNNEEDSELALKGYNILGISAKFKTWLKDFETSFGNYGLRLYVKDGNGETIALDFDSSLMYGDAYNFMSPIQQEAIFDISNIEEIRRMSLVLYQRKNFETVSEEKIPYKSITGGKLPDNIFVYSPELYFGYNISNFKDGEVLLTTSKSLTYGHSEASRTKDLLLRWFLDKDNIIDNDYEFEDLQTAKIRWYQYHQTEHLVESDDMVPNWFELYSEAIVSEEEYNENPDLYFEPVGAYEYQKATEFKTPLYQKTSGINFDNIILNSSQDEEKFYAVIEYPSKESQLNLYYNDAEYQYLKIIYDFLNDGINGEEISENAEGLRVFLENNLMELTTEQISTAFSQKYECENSLETILNKILFEQDFIKTEYTSKVKYYKSNILTFTNLNSTVDTTTLNYLNGIQLKIDVDGYNGIYFLYDSKNRINNLAEAQMKRILEADCSRLELDGGPVDKDSFCWYLPIHFSMIEPAEDYTLVKMISGGSYYNFTEADETTATHYKIEKEIALYRIKENYNINYTNNEIYFQTKKGDIIYEQSAELSFGPKGSYGLDYTFLLTPVENRPLILSGEMDFITLKPKLLDSNGKEIPITGVIEYNWYSEPVIKDTNVIDHFEDGQDFSCTIKLTPYQGLAIESLEHGIMEAKLAGQVYNNTQVDFYAYYPLSVSTFNEKEVFYYGATNVCYNSLNCSPEYFRDSHRLFINGEEIENLEWKVNSPETLSGVHQFYPFFNGDKLVTPGLYLLNQERAVSIEAWSEGQIVFCYPLRIYRDAYNSSVLNSWDGKLTIDKKNDTILSPMIGVGKIGSGEDGGSAFDGLLMGTVEDRIGLFGLRGGIQTFGFNIDGTAILGNPIGTRIEFDATKALQKFSTIDKEYVNTVTIDTSNKESLFKITHSKANLGNGAGRERVLFNVGTSGYYLQSANYIADTISIKSDKTIESSPTEGLKIDLTNGILESSSLKLSSFNKENRFYINTSDTRPFQIGEDLSFGWNGQMKVGKINIDNFGIRADNGSTNEYKFYLNTAGNRDFSMFDKRDFDDSKDGEWKNSIYGKNLNQKFFNSDSLPNYFPSRETSENFYWNSTALFIGKGKQVVQTNIIKTVYYTDNIKNNEENIENEKMFLQTYLEEHPINSLNFKYSTSEVVSVKGAEKYGYCKYDQLPESIKKGLSSNGIYIYKEVYKTKTFYGIEPVNFLNENYFSVNYGGMVFCSRLYTKQFFAHYIFCNDIFFLKEEDDVKRVFLSYNYNQLQPSSSGGFYFGEGKPNRWFSDLLKNEGLITANYRHINNGSYSDTWT